MTESMKAMKDQQKAMHWAVLELRTLTARAQETGTPPDFTLLRQLMNYLDRVAEKQHQPNEDEHLFRALEARAPDLKRLIHRLRRDHSAMTGYRIRLAEAVGYWQKGDDRSGRHATIVAEDYQVFCERHLREERELLGRLREVLSEAEWAEAERGFDSVADPVAAASSTSERETAVRQYA